MCSMLIKYGEKKTSSLIMQCHELFAFMLNLSVVLQSY